MNQKLGMVACPNCKNPVPVSDDFFPFCSERCQTRDLANWASDAYGIPDEPNFDHDHEHGALH